jgi:hypothetical protein
MIGQVVGVKNTIQVWVLVATLTAQLRASLQRTWLVGSCAEAESKNIDQEGSEH